MQIYLELSGHPKANIQRVALKGDTVIGRSKKCGLQIVSPSVSRSHCKIQISEKRVTVTDLGSANGTFLNAGKLNAGEEYSLFEGARLNIGGIRFLVSFKEQAVEPAADSPVGQEADTQMAAVATGAAGESSETLTGDVLPVEEDEEFLLSDSSEDMMPRESDSIVSEDRVTVAEEMLLDQGALDESSTLAGDETSGADAVENEFLLDEEDELAVLETESDAPEGDEESLVADASEEFEKADDAFLGDGEEPLAVEEEDLPLSVDESLVEDEFLAEEEDAEAESSPALAEPSGIDSDDDQILGSDDEILFDDDDATDSGASRLVFGDTTPPAEPVAESDEIEEDDELFAEEATADEATEEPILANDEPILGYDEDEDFANSFLSDSDVDLGGPAPIGATVEANLVNDDENDDFEFEADDEEIVSEDEASTFELADDDEEGEADEEAPHAQERPAPPAAPRKEEEPILPSDDEDQAFAFLDDDVPPSKKKNNDSHLGDFLSQLGRD